MTQKKDKKDVKNYKKEAKEHLEGWKRTKADFENYKKEEKKRLEELVVFVKASLILNILPILDSFDQALKHVPEKEKDSDWVRGIIKIQDQLKEILAKEEIKEIKAKGKEFDPQYHEAVGEAVGKKTDKDKIIKVLQKGYIMAGRVIRPARVYIGK